MPIPDEVTTSIREAYNAGRHDDAVKIGMQHADALGLDRDELWRAPTTDAAVQVLKALRSQAVS